MPSNMSTMSTAPDVKDLTTDNITQNVHLVNANCQDERLKFVLGRMVTHLHELARETNLTTDEWMASLNFLTSVGQICTDVRQEFILLSDILGLSLLVDAQDNPKPADATQGTVLGPFHTHEAKEVENGSLISQDSQGSPMLMIGTVKDMQGNPVEDVKIDVWETDSSGRYDVQHADRNGPDGRGIVHSGTNGDFWFKAIVPVPYPIPHDGPVGQLLSKLNRHPMRPSHMHFLMEKDGYDRLITALYLRDDPYINSDAVFGVKTPLIVDLLEANEEHKEKYGVDVGTKLIKYDFVLITDQEAKALRAR